MELKERILKEMVVTTSDKKMTRQEQIKTIVHDINLNYKNTLTSRESQIAYLAAEAGLEKRAFEQRNIGAKQVLNELGRFVKIREHPGYKKLVKKYNVEIWK